MKTLILILSLSASTACIASSGFNPSMKTFFTKGINREKAVIVSNTSVRGQFLITSSTEGTIEFFIFDFNGQLSYQAQLENKQTKTVTGLKKGIYLYTVQLKDEKLEEGKLIIK
jgi:peroxiredoxin